MIIGLGTDLVEVERMAKSIETTGFREKIFSPGEIVYCESKVNKAESYAARFAAKEAFFKALGTGWRGGMAFHEIEVINNKLGKPDILINGAVREFIEKKKIARIHVSLSHLKQMATAFVILEK